MMFDTELLDESLDETEVDSIEAEAEACIAEIDALLTEATKAGLYLDEDESSMSCWHRVLRSPHGGLVANVLFGVCYVATNIVSSILQREYGAHWVLLAMCVGMLFTLAFLHVGQRCRVIRYRSSDALISQNQNVLRAAASIFVLTYALVRSLTLTPDQSSAEALRYINQAVPVYVLVLQSRVLDFGATLSVTLAVLLIGFGGGVVIYSPQLPSVALGTWFTELLAATSGAAYLVAVRLAFDRTGLSESGCLWHVFSRAMLPLVIVAALVGDISAAVSGFSALPSGLGIYFFVSAILFTLQHYTLLLCTNINSPVTAAVIGASTDTLIYLCGAVVLGGFGIQGWVEPANWTLAKIGAILASVGVVVYGVVVYRQAKDRATSAYSLILSQMT